MLQVTPDLSYLVSSGSDNQLIIWTWAKMSLTQVNTYAMSVSGTVKSGVLIAPTYTGSNKKKLYKISSVLFTQVSLDLIIYVIYLF
jgi:hypothetical protein